MEDIVVYFHGNDTAVDFIPAEVKDSYCFDLLMNEVDLEVRK